MGCWSGGAYDSAHQPALHEADGYPLAALPAERFA